MEQGERTFPEGSVYRQAPFLEHTKPIKIRGKRKAKNRIISSYVIITRRIVEICQFIALKIRCKKCLPGVLVGHARVGATHTLLVHSPYVHLSPPVQLAPIAPTDPGTASALAL